MNPKDSLISKKLNQNKVSIDEIAEKSINDLEKLLTRYEENVVFKKALNHRDISE